MTTEIDAHLRALWDDAPTSRRVRVRTERAATLEDLRKLLEGKRGSGWICTTSEQPGEWDGTWRELPILSAELAVSGEESVHVRYADDGWLVTTIGEPAEGETAVSCVAYDTTYRSSLDGRRPPGMSYRVFWKAAQADTGGVSVLRPYVARFLGWDSSENA